MKTLILEEPYQFKILETKAPSGPGLGEAIVRVCSVGICGSDISAYLGKNVFLNYPRVLGHELGVKIVDIGPNQSGLMVGDYCAVEPYLHCGRCSPCLRRRPNCCVDLKYYGVHIDGGMCEYLRVPINKLHRSTSLAPDLLALVEPLTIGSHAVQRANIEPGETVVVIGAGPIGLATMQFAYQAGAKVYAIEVNEKRLSFCTENLPIEVGFCVRENPLEELMVFLSGELPTVVFDATGNVASMKNAFQFVSPSGKLIFVGVTNGEISFNDGDFHLRELTVIASRNSVGEDFIKTIRLLEKGNIDISKWITHRASPEKSVEDFPIWTKPDSGVVKALIEW